VYRSVLVKELFDQLGMSMGKDVEKLMRLELGHVLHEIMKVCLKHESRR